MLLRIEGKLLLSKALAMSKVSMTHYSICMWGNLDSKWHASEVPRCW